MEHNKWLTGQQVGFLDFALLGHLQCMTTGLTDELLPIIKRQHHILRWIKDLLPIIKNDSTPLYTQRILQPEIEFQKPNFLYVLIFWCSWLVYILVSPLTILLIIVSIRNRFKNPAHSGAVISKHQQKQKNLS